MSPERVFQLCIYVSHSARFIHSTTVSVCSLQVVGMREGGSPLSRVPLYEEEDQRDFVMSCNIIIARTKSLGVMLALYELLIMH